MSGTQTWPRRAAVGRRARGSPPCWRRRGQAGARGWSRLGLFVPRTAPVKISRVVHESVAPTNRSGQVAAMASVRDGASNTTRLGLGASSAAYPRSSTISTATGLDVAAVLATDLEERLGHLLEGAHASRAHEDVEDVATLDGDLPELLESGLRLDLVLLLERAHTGQLALLLLLGASGQLDGLRLLVVPWCGKVLTPMMGSEPSCLRCS